MTSIKEALEQIASVETSLDKTMLLCQIATMKRVAAEALASLSCGEARERIARIIDPGSFYIRDESNGLMCTVECNGALAAADAILASGLAPNESAIRADERERCARIADLAGFQHGDNASRAAMADEIAAAIRAGRDEG